MTGAFRILANTYYDSVFLMGIAGRLGRQPGVVRTAALMATPKNKAVLEEFGVPAEGMASAGPSDLVLGVLAASPEEGAAALALVDGWLQEEAAQSPDSAVTSLDGALQLLPGANLAVISVPGEYAAYEARRALETGLHVFLFSDNVSLEDEIALKREAAERGLLVMGPDCGTALIAGAGIGFANAVRRGTIGIVGPSGTGIQQVSTLIHQAGAGVSHAIGTGSRDLSDEVGGITTLAALDALAEDGTTEVLLIVSKPPAAATRRRVLDWIASSAKPVVTCFLGQPTPDEDERAGALHYPERTLAAAAARAVALPHPRPLSMSRHGEARSSMHASGSDGHPDTGSPRLAEGLVESHVARFRPGQRYVRGLFAGGTFCYEAQQIFLEAGIEVRSNAPLRKDLRLGSPVRSEGNTLIDLGDDQFTQGRPHPMIDATLRNERIALEAADPEVAVLLLDFILGYGAAADPAGDVLPAIRAARRTGAEAGRHLAVVASVCGTDGDPQNRARQVEILEASGVLVASSSSEAAALAAALIAGRPALDAVGARQEEQR